MWLDEPHTPWKGAAVRSGSGVWDFFPARWAEADWAAISAMHQYAQWRGAEEDRGWPQEGFYSHGSLLARVRLRTDDMWEGEFHWTNCLFTSTAPIPWCHWVRESWTPREIITSALTGGHWRTHLSSMTLNLRWVHKKFCQVRVLEGSFSQ